MQNFSFFNYLKTKTPSGGGITRVIIISLFATLACVGIIKAATTIGTNISTGGTITGSGANTLYGATSVGGALTATSTLNVTGLSIFDSNVGIGTSSPYAKLSVVGEIVGSYFTATSTTATSTFANGIYITSGCFRGANGSCITSGGSTSPGGSDTQVQFNNSSSFGGDSGLTFNSATDKLTVGGDLSVTGNATTTGSLAVSGGLGVTGCLSVSHPAPNYQAMGQMLDIIDSNSDCSLLLSWLNVGDNNIETNKCGNDLTITYTDASNFTASDQLTLGQSYILDFDGSDDVVTITDSNYLTFDADFTVGMWLKAPAERSGGIVPFIEKWGAGGNEWRLSYTASTRQLGFRASQTSVGGATPLSTGATSLTTGTWYFVVVTHADSLGSGATFSAGTHIYLNGVEDSTTHTENVDFVDMENGTSNVLIGNDSTYYTAFQAGKPFIVKGRALTAAQIKRLYIITRGYMCQ